MTKHLSCFPAVSPKFEFGTCDPNFSNKIPTCVHLELNHEKETFVKVEQRKQEWDAKLSPSSVMSGSASPGTPSGVTGNQDQWSNLGSSKCQTSKEVKREVVLKEMHNDKEKENDLKRKQVLLFKQKQAPAPPVVVIKEKEKGSNSVVHSKRIFLETTLNFLVSSSIIYTVL